jgi:hypothetical protein
MKTIDADGAGQGARKRRQGQGLVRAGETDFLRGKVSTLAPTETPGINPPPKPTEFRNSQLSLFQEFLCNKEEERDSLSNAVDLWDSIPRHSVKEPCEVEITTDAEYVRQGITL